MVCEIHSKTIRWQALGVLIWKLLVSSPYTLHPSPLAFLISEWFMIAAEILCQQGFLLKSTFPTFQWVQWCFSVGGMKGTLDLSFDMSLPTKHCCSQPTAISRGSTFLLSTSSHISARKSQCWPCVLLALWVGVCHFSLVSLSKEIFFHCLFFLFLLSVGWVLRVKMLYFATFKWKPQNYILSEKPQYCFIFGSTQSCHLIL